MSDDDDQAIKDLSAMNDMLRQQNESTIERITRLGGQIDMASVQMTRDAELAAFIYNDVLTEKQRQTFLLRWHETMASQLKEMEGQARDAKIARDRAKLLRGTSAAAGPSSLIVPGHVRRPSS